MSGYFKLYREFLKPKREWLCRNPLTWSIYTYMAMKAAWGDGYHDGDVYLTEGQVRCSVSFLSSRFSTHKNKISESRVYRSIQDLVEHELISVSNKTHSVYTVTAYRDMFVDEDGSKRESKRESKTNIEDSIEDSIGDKKKTRRFTPPTIDEVREYCKSNGYPIDPEHFVDYNESRGWMIGKNKMKSWQAAVRTWVRNERVGYGKARPQQSTPRTTRPGELDSSSRQETALKELERKANERLRRLGVSGG